MANLKVLENSQIEIEDSIPSADFDEAFVKTIAEARKNVEVPGFRKGMAPEKLVMEKIGEGHLLHEAAEIAISKRWDKLIGELDIEPLGHPSITIKKLARGNPLEFTIVVDVISKIELPDYKKIAREVSKDKKEIKVTEEELDKTFDLFKKNLENDPQRKGVMKPEEIAEVRETIRQNMQFEKEKKQRDEERLKILEGIIKETKLPLPESLVQGEVERMIAELKANLMDMSLNWTEYLEHVKKTEEDLRKEWRKLGEQRAAFGLILREIAKQENLMPAEDQVEKNAEDILKNLSEEERKMSSKELLKDHLRVRMQHELVFDLLEKKY